MKGNLRKALLPVLVVVLMIITGISMTFTAVATDIGGTEGFAYRPQYQSQWQEKYGISQATWGAWPANDGDYNGAFFWTTNFDKMSITDEEVGGAVTGVLNIKETQGLYAVFHPSSRLARGASLIRFDFLYQSGGQFAGFDLTYSSSCPVFRVDAAGKVYAGSTSTSFSDLRTVAGAGASGTIDGWYTVEVFFIPVDASGNAVTIPEGASDTEVDTLRGTIAKNLVYVRFSSYANPIPETKGITLTELEASARKIEWTADKCRNFYTDLGSSMTVKPTVSGTGTLKIANAAATLLVPDQTLYKVTYSGFERPASYTTAESPALTAPALPGVKAWRATSTAGDIGYYEPGNTLQITGDTVMEAVTGENEIRMAQLRSAVQRLDTAKLYRYSYAEIQEADAALDAALTNVQSTPFASDPLVTEAKAIQALLGEQKAYIAQYGEKLIAAAAVFGDSTRSFAERIAAYDSVRQGCYDATYSTASDDDRCEAAVAAREAFAVQLMPVEENWKRYQAALAQIKLTVGYANVESAVLELVDDADYRALAAAFPSGAPDPELESVYFGCMTEMKDRFDAFLSVPEKFEYLKAWMTRYNTYKAAVYGTERAAHAPEALQQAVKAYNEIAVSLNRDIAAAATVSLASQITLCECDAAVPMITDVKQRLEALAEKSKDE